MGIHAVLTQGMLHIILVTVTLHTSHTYGSPLSNDSLCPRGWYQYDRFCVTRGLGTSDRAVALYCDGFGGIGIKGLCIIKVHSKDAASSLVREENPVNFSQGLPMSSPNILKPAPDDSPMFAALSEDDNAISQYLDGGLRDDSSSSSTDIDILNNRVRTDDGLCPNGWAHYGSVCVYKPWSVAERCHLLNSVEFHGLCVRHAELQTAARRDLEHAKSKEKRICCCASFKAKGNKYGC